MKIPYRILLVYLWILVLHLALISSLSVVTLFNASPIKSAKSDNDNSPPY